MGISQTNWIQGEWLGAPAEQPVTLGLCCSKRSYKHDIAPEGSETQGEQYNLILQG